MFAAVGGTSLLAPRTGATGTSGSAPPSITRSLEVSMTTTDGRVGRSRHGGSRPTGEHLLAADLLAGRALTLVACHTTGFRRQRRPCKRPGWLHGCHGLRGEPAHPFLAPGLELGRGRAMDPGDPRERARRSPRRTRRHLERARGRPRWQPCDRGRLQYGRALQLAAHCLSPPARSHTPGAGVWNRSADRRWPSYLPASWSWELRVPGRARSVYSRTPPSGWQLEEPPLPSSIRDIETSVLRLRSFDGGVSALIAAGSGARTALFGTRLAGHARLVDSGWVPPRANRAAHLLGGLERWWAGSAGLFEQRPCVEVLDPGARSLDRDCRCRPSHGRGLLRAGRSDSVPSSSTTAG